MIEQLRGRLLPVEIAGEGEAIAHGLREAAVLILLYERDGDPRFPLTLRPDTLTHHPAQISLPGGGVEAGDASAWDTAARETEEELGIPASAIRPVGRLQTIGVHASGHRVVPFVGCIDTMPALRPQPNEVAEVIEARMAALLEPASVEVETWPFREAEWRVVFFRLGGHVVWGATARILSDFAERLDPERCWPAGLPGGVTRISAS